MHKRSIGVLYQCCCISSHYDVTGIAPAKHNLYFYSLEKGLRIHIAYTAGN